MHGPGLTRDVADVDSIYYLFIPLVLLLGITQSSLMPYFRFEGQYPDLVLVLVVAWSLLRGTRHGVLLALLGGIVLDILSGAPFGIFTVALVCAGFLSGLGLTGFFRSPLVLSLLGMVAGTLVYYAVTLALLAISDHAILWLQTLQRTVLPALAVNCASMLLVFPLTRFVHVRTALREMEW